MFFNHQPVKYSGVVPGMFDDTVGIPRFAQRINLAPGHKGPGALPEHQQRQDDFTAPRQRNACATHDAQPARRVRVESVTWGS